MSNQKKSILSKKGATIALAAAALFTTTAALGYAYRLDPVATNTIRCQGINACKGQSACNGRGTCGGVNACKGQGWLNVTREECVKRGGRVLG
jgi:hypothetical protein